MTYRSRFFYRNRARLMVAAAFVATASALLAVAVALGGATSEAPWPVIVLAATGTVLAAVGLVILYKVR